MYMVYCKDPNCAKCKQALEGQISEEAECKILRTVEELLAVELILASHEKRTCLETCKKLKDKVHYQINALVDVLKERERVLCNQIDLEYASQVAKIDCDVVKCSMKLLQKKSEPEKLHEKIQPSFISDFDDLKNKLQNFGFLSYETGELSPTSVATPLAVGSTTTPISQKDTNPELLKINEGYLKESQKLDGVAAEYSQMGEELDDILKLLQVTKMERRPEQCGAKKIKTKCPKLAETKYKDTFEDSMNEDDIEFINRNEIANIPSELPLNPPLPSKKKCWFIKRPSFGSLNKGSTSKKDSKSESPGIVENEFHGWSATSENSSISSGYNTERASINEQEQESCSNVEDPSAALLASFAKYLEKNADSEWLAPKKITEHWLSSGNNCISHLSLIDKKDVGLYEYWLPEKNIE